MINLTHIFKVFFQKELPLWFRFINLLIFLPVLIWPLIFFMTIFIFDDPTASKTSQYGLFYAINAYPLYLYLLALTNISIFKKWKFSALILPALAVFSLIGFFIILLLN